MKCYISSLIVCSVFVACILSSVNGFFRFYTHQRVLLRDVESLVFKKNAFSSGIRTDSFPQLTCVGAGCDDYDIHAVLCTNVGFSGSDVNWKCETQETSAPTLSFPLIRFKNLIVSCEGYDFPNDPYVLQGSCVLEYSIQSSKVDPMELG